MVVTLAQLQADADAISTSSPKIRQFAADVVAYLKQVAPAPAPAPAPSPTLGTYGTNTYGSGTYGGS